MTTTRNSIAISTDSILKHVIYGAGLALILIGLFLFGIDNPNPNWPEFWMLRPLIIVPLAGAMGGIWIYLCKFSLKEKKIIANIIGILGYIIAIWLGSVLGLDGTLWN